MMHMTMTIDFPALDRLCDWLENRDKTDLVGAIENEIVEKLKEAAEGGVPKPKFDAPTQESRKAPQAPTKPETTEKPTAPATPAPAAPAATLEAIQQAAAQLRDQGKLGDVTALFPEFGIKKLSELKGDQLQTFGERLRAMGAKI
ncbi:MAG: hypothetical protein IKE76_12970 [Clostridia bacterium]|nr:hypothetical protein [Clostridia bacterium]